jgi:hypothetical protein
MPKLKYNDFNKFFESQVNRTEDDLLAQFLDRGFLENFKLRQLKMIYSAVEQFHTGCNLRVSKFATHFVNRGSLKTIPNTWLMSRRQSPSTFIMLINSFIPQIDESILYEIYIIVHNRKVSLLRDLRPFLNKEPNSEYIKHREAENLKKSLRKKVVNLPMKSTTSYPLLPVGDENIGDFPYQQYISYEGPSEISASLVDHSETHEGSGSRMASPGPNIPQPDDVTLQHIADLMANGQWTPAPTESPTTSSSTIAPTKQASSTPLSSTQGAGFSTSFTPISSNPASAAPPPQEAESTTRSATLGWDMSDPQPFESPELYLNSLLNNQTSSSLMTGSPGADSEVPEVSMPVSYSNRVLAESMRSKRSPLSQLKSLVSTLATQGSHSSDLKSRQRRSGFWTSIFGVATSDDLIKAYENEIDIGIREDRVEKTVSLITDKTNELLTNYKSMALDLEKVERQEKTLFHYIDNIVKAETDSIKKLETLAKSIDRITVMNSELSSINVQTMLLIHSIEKLHTLVLMGLLGTLDVAQMPTELLQHYSVRNIKIAVRSTHVEFLHSDKGYEMKLRIPTLSEPYIMYNLVAMPLYLENHWSSVSLKNTVIVNSVLDSLETHIPLSSVCEQEENHYICNPSNVVIRHSQSSCELDIVQAIGNPKPAYPNCEYNRVKLNAESQYAMIIRDKISVSSMIEDSLNYICDNPQDSKVVPIEIGFRTYDLKPGCVYETRTLTIYNVPKYSKVGSYRDTDTELDLITAIGSLESMLDDALASDVSNSSNIELIVKGYEKIQGETEITYSKLAEDIRLSQSVEKLNEFSPLEINTRHPKNHGNWLSGIFWIILVVIIMIILIVICVLCPGFFPLIGSCFAGIFKGLKTCCSISCCPPKETGEQNDLEMAGTEGAPFLPQAPLSTKLFSPDGDTSVVYPDTSKNAPLTDPRMDLIMTPANAPSRYPDLENFYETTSPGHQWKITKGRYDEYLITTTVPDGQNHIAIMFYDIPDGIAIDQSNRPHPYIRPPGSELITKFQEKVRKSPPPNYLSSNGTLYLPNAPHIVFNRDIHKWVNKNTKRVISGLNSPIQL